MHSLVDFCMCPDWGSNVELGHIRTTLQPTELLSRDLNCLGFFSGFTGAGGGTEEGEFLK